MRSSLVKALGVLALCQVGAACVLPPPLEEIAGLVNQAPVVLTSTLEPSVTSMPLALPLDPTCLPTFSAVIRDPDGGKDLAETEDIENLVFLRYFVDYSTIPKDEQPRQSSQLSLDPSNGFRGEFSFRPDFDYFQGGGTHTIELLVADNSFLSFSAASLDQFRRPAPFAANEAYAGEDGLTDSFVWTLVFDDSAPCPTDAGGLDD